MRQTRQHRHSSQKPSKERCGSRICNARPRGQLVASLGDEHPFEYGGYFIYDQGDGTYAGHYWEEIEDSATDDEDGNESEGNRFSLYRFDIPADVYAAHDWAKQNIASIVDTIDRDPDDMIEGGRSSDVQERAWAMRDIASTWGWGRFGRESTWTEDELRDCYGRDHDLFKRRGGGRYVQPSPQLELDLDADDAD